MFVEMFQANPDTQHQFSNFRGIDQNELSDTPQMIQYRTKVVATIGQVIDNVDNTRMLWDLLIKFGRDHFSKFAILQGVPFKNSQSKK